jgi:hypothetical protein
MEKFVVFVRSEESTVNLKVSGCEITVYIPASDHTENVQLHKNIGSWSVDLLHNNPGFGKPYLLKLTNQEKVRYLFKYDFSCLVHVFGNDQH